MDCCTPPNLQALISQGYGLAAQFLGTTFDAYRPSDPMVPIQAPAIATLTAAFDSDAKFSFGKPAPYGKPLYYGLVDPTELFPGDYLLGDPTVEAPETYFLASFEALNPPLFVRCNRIIDLLATADAAGQDADTLDSPNQNGRTDADDVPLLIGWPASVLTKTRGEQPPSRLPGDQRAAYFEVLLPLSITKLPQPVKIEPGHRLRDDLGQTYTVATAELSHLGWRLLAVVNQT